MLVFYRCHNFCGVGLLCVVFADTEGEGQPFLGQIFGATPVRTVHPRCEMDVKHPPRAPVLQASHASISSRWSVSHPVEHHVPDLHWVFGREGLERVGAVPASVPRGNK